MKNQPNDDIIHLDFGENKVLSQMTFVCNVNTREISQDPNNIMIDFVSNNKETLMGIKTPRSIAIIQFIKEKATQKYIFEDPSHLNLSSFKFFDQDHIILGFKEGSVQIRQLTQFKHKFIELNGQNDKILIQKKVLRIHTYEYDVLVLFYDGIVVLYDTKKTYENGQIDKFFKLYFNDHKKLVPNQLCKSFGYYQFLNYGEFTNFSLQQKIGNPVQIFRFENQMNEVIQLPQNPLKYLKNYEEYQEQKIIAMSGLDGYFRIMDTQNRPLFSFKTEYGGILSFSFNQTFQMVCIASQDDSVYVVNFVKQISYIKIIGHNSFIQRAAFSSISASDFRIICGCLDGSVSFTDLKLNQLKEQNSLFIKAQNKYEIIIIRPVFFA
ncbi:hypothetical protein pb186bvf_009907 [Paramecium bursaria]